MTGPRIPARRFFVGRAVESGMNHDVAVMYVVAIEDEAVAAERERLRAAASGCERRSSRATPCSTGARRSDVEEH